MIWKTVAVGARVFTMISSFEKKPATGGNLARARVEMTKVPKVICILRHNLPMSFFTSKEGEAEWPDRPRSQEEAGLEEGVGEDVEHGREPRSDAEAHHHHVAESKWVEQGQHPSDVDLHEGEDQHDDDRDAADDGDQADVGLGPILKPSKNTDRGAR